MRDEVRTELLDEVGLSRPDGQHPEDRSSDEAVALKSCSRT